MSMASLTCPNLSCTAKRTTTCHCRNFLALARASLLVFLYMAYLPKRATEGMLSLAART